MKQFNFEIHDSSEVQPALSNVREWIGCHSVKTIFFHLFTISFTKEQVREVQRNILEIIPDAHIVGTSTGGDICDGHLAAPGMVMSVSVFGDTDIRVKPYHCEPGNEAETGTCIREDINSAQDLAAAELLITLKTINSNIILKEVEKCRPGLPVFGGGSANEIIDESESFVLDSFDVLADCVAVVFYIGKELHVDLRYAIGWKKLGKNLKVTDIKDKRLYSLDNKPAADIYSRYLDIQADDDFFSNILEFPLMDNQHGIEVLRLPFSCRREDGSILLAADIQNGSTVNLSYGDPQVIKEEVKKVCEEVEGFAPEAVFLYSCSVRKLYWKHLINEETSGFTSLAPTAGFYSSGEIIRIKNYLIEHHVTLVVAAMREGPAVKLHPVEDRGKEIEVSEQEKIHGQISMVRRLATFINVTSAELRQANEELRIMADMDELTGLYNRRMIEKLARENIRTYGQEGSKVAIAILDIDDFKKVNDTYGHYAGDAVLSGIAAVMGKEVKRYADACLGRWGGEEFVIIIPDTGVDEALVCMENIRNKVSDIEFEDVGRKTLSIGLTECLVGETLDDAFQRADQALYEAKETGKNKAVILLNEQ